MHLFRKKSFPKDNDKDFNELRRLTQRSIIQQIGDWVFGYDFFISYRWSDGRIYAINLAKALKKKGYDCFLDTEDYLPGANWIVGGEIAIKKTTRLIYICTQDAVFDPKGRKGNEDPIIRELSTFEKGGRNKIRIKVHEIDNSIWEDSAISKYFRKEDLYIIDQHQSPSEEVIEYLDRGCRLEKRDRRRLRLISSVCLVILAFAIGLTATSFFALWQKSQRNLTLAEVYNTKAEKACNDKCWSDAAIYYSESLKYADTSAARLGTMQAISNGGIELFTYKHADSINMIDISRNEKYITSCSADKTIKLISIENWEEIKKFPKQKESTIAITFSFNSRYIISVSSDSTITFWPINANDKAITFKKKFANVNTACFSPDRTKIALVCENKKIIILSINWGYDYGDINLSESYSLSTNESIESICFSYDNEYIVMGTSNNHSVGSSSGGNIKNRINIHSVGKNKYFYSPHEQKNIIFSTTFSPFDKYIAFGYIKNSIALYDFNNDKIRTIFDGHEEFVTAIAFSADGKYIISGSHDNTVRIWSVFSEFCISVLKGHSAQITSVSISQTGKYIISGSHDNSVKVWLINNDHYLSISNKRTLNSVSFSSDGKYIVARNYDETVKLLAFENKNENVKLVTFSPHNKYNISEKGDSIENLPFEYKQLIFNSHKGSVNSISYSSDKKYIISGYSDNKIKLWSVRDKKCIQTIDNYDKVNFISFLPDEKYIISIGNDNTVIRFWEIKSGNLILTLKNYVGKPHSATFSPDCKYFVTGNEDNTVRIYETALNYKKNNLLKKLNEYINKNISYHINKYDEMEYK